MRTSCFIAGRLGAHHGRRRLSGMGNVIATVSVAVSIAVIIISMAVSGGFRYEIKEKAVGFCGDAVIAPYGATSASDADMSGYSMRRIPYLSEIEALPFVKNVQAVSYRPGLIKTDDEIQGVVLKGIGEDYDTGFFRDALVGGRLPEKDSSEILVSKRMAAMLGFSIGDKATIYFISDAIKVRRFRVSGIYSAQLEEYDKLYVITGIGEVNSVNGWDGNTVSNYEVIFRDHKEKEMRRRGSELSSVIYENAQDGDPALSVTGLDASMYRLLDWLRLLDTNVLIILILMIAVAGFNMVSCILIILFENISTIGVFKTMGMKDATVKEVFLAMGCRIVLYGLAAGNILALTLCLVQKKFGIVTLDPDNYFLTHVPVRIDIWKVLLADTLSFAAIMLILTVPCHFISRINPARTVRFK